MSNIYFDNNATTALEPAVLTAMQELLTQPLNPSSTHGFGRKAHGILENARIKIAALANAKDSRVIFTSSGTEANNLAIMGLAGFSFITSAIEHPSVLKTVKNHGGIIAPVMPEGVIDLKALAALLGQIKGKCLVSVMLANNETGIIQPLKEVVEVAHKFGALVHTDASQCFGKIQVDMEKLGVDMLTLCAHKFGGPQGAAALIVKKHVPLHALMIGGGQEQNYRAGSQNVAAIHGFGAAANIAMELQSQTEILRNNLELQIKAITPNARIFGEDTNRLPNTSLISMPNVSAETQLIHFDLNGIALSSGSACSSGKIEISHVLKAMGTSDEIAKTAIRISLGKNNKQSEVATFIAAWSALYSKVNQNKKAA